MAQSNLNDLSNASSPSSSMQSFSVNERESLRSRIGYLENELSNVLDERDLLRAILKITIDDSQLKTEQFNSLFTSAANPNRSDPATQDRIKGIIDRSSISSLSLLGDNNNNTSNNNIDSKINNINNNNNNNIQNNIQNNNINNNNDNNKLEAPSSPSVFVSILPPRPNKRPSHRSVQQMICSLQSSPSILVGEELFSRLPDALFDYLLEQHWKLNAHYNASLWKKNVIDRHWFTQQFSSVAANEQQKTIERQQKIKNEEQLNDVIENSRTKLSYEQKMREKLVLEEWLSRKHHHDEENTANSSSNPHHDNNSPSSINSSSVDNVDKIRFQRLSSPVSSSLLYTSSRIASRSPASFWKVQFEERYKIERKWRGFGKPTLMTLSGHTGTITALKFDEKRLISASDDGSCVLWQLADQRSMAAASGLDGGSVGILQQQHHKNSKLCYRDATFGGHAGPVWCLDFRADTLVTGSYDRAIAVWSIKHNAVRGLLRGHSSWISGVSLHPSDQSIVASASWDASIKLWKLQDDSMHVKDDADEKFPSSSSSTSPSSFHSSHSDSTIRPYSMIEGFCNATLQNEAGNVIYSIQWLPNGDRLVAGCRHNCVQIWDTANERVIRTLFGHNQQVYCVQIDEENENIIATGSGDHTIKLFDSRVDGCLMTLRAHNGSVMGISFNHLGRLVSGSYDKIINVWDLKKYSATPSANDLSSSSNSNDPSINALQRTLEGHSSAVFALQADYNKIISGSADKKIILWDFDNY